MNNRPGAMGLSCRQPHASPAHPVGRRLLLCLLWLAVTQTPALAQPALPGPGAQDRPAGESPSAPKTVDVQPEAPDERIALRLQNIMQATQWFDSPQVHVKEGVVFLDGRTAHVDYRDWAGALARNTQSVVAVVNRITLTKRTIFDLTPAMDELHTLATNTVQAAPFIVSGLLLLLLSVFAARFAYRLSRRLLSRRMDNLLLRDVTTRALSILVFLFGLYLVLRVSGLTRLALTVLGGTGIAGLIIGIAFRDIMENFLASMLISMQNPFHAGDLIEVAGYTGLVQQVTMRGTVLMDFEGNHVQIPNATIYKEVIRNYTANPKRRSDFTVGISYDDLVPVAQDVAMQVLSNHPAILHAPEPLVLVESLGASTVNLRVLFWVDGNQHDWRKVKSSVIRLVKRAFQQAGIAMPDDAREIIFPQGVPLRTGESQGEAIPDGGRHVPLPAAPAEEPEAVATAAEGDLRSEEQQIHEQARQARSPEGNENLLQR